MCMYISISLSLSLSIYIYIYIEPFRGLSGGILAVPMFRRRENMVGVNMVLA